MLTLFPRQKFFWLVIESKYDTYFAPIADSRWDADSFTGYISTSVEAYPAKYRASRDTGNSDSLLDFLPCWLLLRSIHFDKSYKLFNSLLLFNSKLLWDMVSWCNFCIWISKDPIYYENILLPLSPTFSNEVICIVFFYNTWIFKFHQFLHQIRDQYFQLSLGEFSIMQCKACAMNVSIQLNRQCGRVRCWMPHACVRIILCYMLIWYNVNVFLWPHKQSTFHETYGGMCVWLSKCKCWFFDVLRERF